MKSCRYEIGVRPVSVRELELVNTQPSEANSSLEAL